MRKAAHNNRILKNKLSGSVFCLTAFQQVVLHGRIITSKERGKDGRTASVTGDAENFIPLRSA